MFIINIVQLTGRIGGEVTLKYTQSEKAVCNFSLAVPTGYGDNKKTEWVNCVAWEKKAEAISKYLVKGSPIIITKGRLQTRNYEKNGAKVYVTEVVIEEFEFVMKDKLQGEREIESQVDSRVEKNTGIDVLDSAAEFELPDFDSDEDGSGLPF